jgi:hypothetical protein
VVDIDYDPATDPKAPKSKAKFPDGDKAKVIAALNELENTQNGQEILKAVLAKQQSDTYAEGVYKGQKIKGLY